MQSSAGDGDIRSFGGCKHIATPAAKAAAVCTTGSIESIVAGHQADVASGDVNGQPLNALVALGDLDGAVGHSHSLIAVDAVIPGGDGELPTGNGHITVGMEPVVRRIKGVASPLECQCCDSLDSLGAGSRFLGVGGFNLASRSKFHGSTLGSSVGAAASGFYGEVAVFHQEIGAGTHAITFRSKLESAIGDIEKTKAGVFGVFCVNGVFARLNGVSAAGDANAVLSREALAGSSDVVCPAGEDQIVLGDHPMTCLGVDSEHPGSVQGKIGFGKDSPVDVVVINGHVFSAVGEGVF